VPSLLTTFVIAPAYLLWDRMREHFTGVSRRHGVLTDDDGLVRLELPPGWLATGALNVQASLQVCDQSHRRFLLVISEPREDYEAAMTLERHSSATRNQLTAEMRVYDVRGPEFRQVGGCPAVQYVIEGSINLSIVRYLHTTIKGERAFHQVLCWATRSRFDRLAFERLLDGFIEIPSPSPPVTPAASPTTLTVEPGSKYDVH
jgi:hypothetical protein